MPLDLTTLLAKARVQNKFGTPKAVLEARLKQRENAERAAQEHARSEEKKLLLQRALSSEALDAMRFRFIAEHPHGLTALAGLSPDEVRKAVDLLIKREAISRLSEMRRKEG